MSHAVGIGWWIGAGVGLVVVLLAAALLVTIIALGRRIVGQADAITAALDGAREHTTPLFDVTRTNFAIDRIARDLKVVRTGEAGAPPQARHAPDPASASPVDALRQSWEERER